MISVLRYLLGSIMSAVGHPMPATVEELRIALTERCYTGFNHWDEIVPGLFLGDADAAKNLPLLKETEITHVLNAAYMPGASNPIGTNDVYYHTRGLNCDFKGICAHDIPSFQIYPFFEEVAEFIDNALKSNGKVLVHCFVGVSRAASLVVAYLMIKRGMFAIEAIKCVRRKRHIYPNAGFLRQICELDKVLRQQRKK